MIERPLPMKRLAAVPAALDVLAVQLERIAVGDRDALRILYRMAAPKMFAVALRALRHREGAEDVLQDVFVTVWNKARLFDRDKGHGLAWLYSITRRKSIDALRKRARDDAQLVPEEVGEFAAAQSPIWVGPETSLTIRACIKTMKPEVRQALALCFTEGRSHQETAIAMAVPLGTVKSWIRRALEVIHHDLSTSHRNAAGKRSIALKHMT